MAPILVAALVVASCGDDDDDDGTDGGAGQQQSSEVLGPVNRATGEPVRVGFVTTGSGTTVVQPEEQIAADAAVRYVNEHLGGIAGRPLELQVCEERTDPTRAQACVNEMVGARVPAVLVSSLGQGAIVANGVTGAGIPYIASLAAGRAELIADPAFILSGSIIGWLAGIIGDAKAKNLTKVSTIVIDVPTIIEGLQQFGPLFQKEGLEFEVVPVPPGTPDMTPQVSSALQGDPDAFWVIGEPTFCTAALRATKTQAPDVATYIIDQCVDDTLAAALPGGLEGITVSSQYNFSPDDPENQLYNAVLDAYGDGDYDRKLAAAAHAFSVVVGFARAMEGLTGEVNAQTVTERMRATREVPRPAAGGLTFTCDGAQVPNLPALCSTGNLITELNEDGTPNEYRSYDGAGLFQP